MGVVGVFFGSRGDGGFNGRCLGASIGDGGFTLVCISGRRGVVGFKVAMSRVLCAKKFALLGLMVGVSAKKFALRTKNGPQSAVYGVLGEFCRTTTQARLLLGCLRLGSNTKAACWERHRRMGMKKALPKECLVEMQNPHRWIAPRGAAARPEGLEPPTF